MDVEASVLPGGLRVVTAALAGFDSVSVGAFVNAGSRNEEPAANGVAHFLEHMAFKGTQTRTAYQISAEIERLGASINAYTSTGTTAYHASGLGETLPEMVDILGDILTNATFERAELETERRVVLQELVRAADTPNSIAFDKYMQTAYRDQPLGRPILGLRSFVEQARPEHFRSFLARHYTARDVVLVACGKVAHAGFVELVGAAFAGLATGPAPARPVARWVGGMAGRASPRFLEVTGVIGWNSVPRPDRRIHCHRMLARAVGGGMSSPLFQEVREKRGLAYAIEASHDSGPDFGEVYVQAGAAPAQIGEVIRVACGVLARATRSIADADFLRARNQALVSTRTINERPFQLARYLAANLFERGRIVLPDEDAAEIARVENADLVAAAREIVQGLPTVAFAGPAPEADYLALIQAELG